MLAPLLDRIELIHVPAYLPIEKLNIGKQYLIPDLEKEYAFKTPVVELVQPEIESQVATTTAQVQEEK